MSAALALLQFIILEKEEPVKDPCTDIQIEKACASLRVSNMHIVQSFVEIRSSSIAPWRLSSLLCYASSIVFSLSLFPRFPPRMIGIFHKTIARDGV